VVLTSTAQSLGPRLSGLLSSAPVFSTILAVFTHRLLGAAPARALLRGVVIGIFAYTVFFLIISILVVPFGIAVAFGLALVAALLTQGSTLWVIRRARRLFASRR
jgi:hypothetical protein